MIYKTDLQEPNSLQASRSYYSKKYRDKEPPDNFGYVAIKDFIHTLLSDWAAREEENGQLLVALQELKADLAQRTECAEQLRSDLKKCRDQQLVSREHAEEMELKVSSL